MCLLIPVSIPSFFVYPSQPPRSDPIRPAPRLRLPFLAARRIQPPADDTPPTFFPHMKQMHNRFTKIYQIELPID